MNFKKYLTVRSYKNFFAYQLARKYKKSWSQCGEDLIIDAFFTDIGVSKPTYIDIGTYHPILNNNTYYFYKKGGHGVLVEPDSEFFKLIKRNRSRDVCLNVGVGPEEVKSANFYRMSSHNLNTFKKDEAERNVTEENYGKQEIKKVVQIPLVTVNSLIEKYLDGKTPDYLSVDAEGLDFEIVSSLDFKKYRPKVICTETLRYGAGGKLEKEKDVEEYLAKHGYVVYADTYVNSIYVDKALLK